MKIRPSASILTMVLALSLAPVVTDARAATVVFDTFGPGDSFNGGVGSTIQGDTAQGIGFTPTTSGYLSEVLIGAGLASTTIPQNLNLHLYGDNAGAPSTILETLSAFVSNLFGQTATTTLFTAAGTTWLDSSDTYWLIAESPGTANIPWNRNSIGAVGLRTLTDNFGPTPTWSIFPSSLANVARITVNDVAAVPVPGALPLLVTGLLAYGFAGRRRARKVCMRR